jgi:CHRD domain/PEP-CTERM motif
MVETGPRENPHAPLIQGVFRKKFACSPIDHAVYRQLLSRVFGRAHAPSGRMAFRTLKGNSSVTFGRSSPVNGKRTVFLDMKKMFLLLVACALPHFCWGQLVYFRADLSGKNENPPNASAGWGTGFASLDESTHWFIFDETFGGLSAPQTAAHIHTGANGVNGPVIIPFLLGSPIHVELALTPVMESNLLAGLFYTNVHTTNFPGGEIRGQLVPVPEPSTYAMAGAAMLGFVILRRKRSKANSTLQS